MSLAEDALQEKPRRDPRLQMPPEMTGVDWQAGTPPLSSTAISRNRSRDLYIHKGVEGE